MFADELINVTFLISNVSNMSHSLTHSLISLLLSFSALRATLKIVLFSVATKHNQFIILNRFIYLPNLQFYKQQQKKNCHQNQNRFHFCNIISPKLILFFFWLTLNYYRNGKGDHVNMIRKIVFGHHLVCVCVYVISTENSFLADKQKIKS